MPVKACCIVRVESFDHLLQILWLYATHRIMREAAVHSGLKNFEGTLPAAVFLVVIEESGKRVDQL